jgi:hypothetical protein
MTKTMLANDAFHCRRRLLLALRAHRRLAGT